MYVTFSRKTTTREEEFHMAQSLFFTYEVGRLLREGSSVDLAQKYLNYLFQIVFTLEQYDEMY